MPDPTTLQAEIDGLYTHSTGERRYVITLSPEGVEYVDPSDRKLRECSWPEWDAWVINARKERR